MKSKSIQTTVVGSYPIPSWLAAYPSTPNLRDAILVVLKTQELAGLDVIADGELSRFNVNHPETNGMIEYFIRPMGNIAPALSREELKKFHATAGMAVPDRVVEEIDNRVFEELPVHPDLGPVAGRELDADTALFRCRPALLDG